MQRELTILEPETCCPIDLPGLLPGEAEEIAGRLKALADPTRVRLLNLLLTRSEGTCVCDLNTVVDLSQPTVSHHLRVLREAGLVEAEQRGTWRYYRANRDAVRKLSDVLRA